MTEHEDEKTRKLVLASLLLDQPDAEKGPPPTFEELWDWMHNKVTPERAKEIHAHVARDANIYEDWRQLRLAQAESQDKEVESTASLPDNEKHIPFTSSKPTQLVSLGERIREFLTHWPITPVTRVTGSVLVVIISLAIGIHYQEREPELDFWRDWHVPKSTLIDRPSSNRSELRALLVGMHQQMLSLSLPPVSPTGQKLPGQLEKCPEGEDIECSERREVLKEIGNLAVIEWKSCLLNQASTDTDNTRINLLLSSIGQNDSITELITPINRWTNASTDSARCSAVGTLMARALTGL